MSSIEDSGPSQGSTAISHGSWGRQARGSHPQSDRGPTCYGRLAETSALLNVVLGPRKVKHGSEGSEPVFPRDGRAETAYWSSRKRLTPVSNGLPRQTSPLSPSKRVPNGPSLSAANRPYDEFSRSVLAIRESLICPSGPRRCRPTSVASPPCTCVSEVAWGNASEHPSRTPQSTALPAQLNRLGTA